MKVARHRKVLRLADFGFLNSAVYQSLGLWMILWKPDVPLVSVVSILLLDVFFHPFESFCTVFQRVLWSLLFQTQINERCGSAANDQGKIISCSKSFSVSWKTGRWFTHIEGKHFALPGAVMLKMLSCSCSPKRALCAEGWGNGKIGTKVNGQISNACCVVMENAPLMENKQFESAKDWATWFALAGKKGSGLENTTVLAIRGWMDSLVFQPS